MSASRRCFTFFILLIVNLMCSAPLHPQDSATGSIRGVVLDAGGARIPQASIVVVNTATNARYVASSDAEGRFVLELLPPGDYSGRAEAEAMSPQVTPPLHVDVGGTDSA